MKTIYLLLLTGLLLLAAFPMRAQGQVAARLAETGPNDFRISHAGADGDASVDALDPAVAFNSTAGEFFIVWTADADVDGAFEVFGQRQDAATGERLGAPVRLSDMGPPHDPAFDALTPKVVFNSLAGEYLVVWSGDDAMDGALAVYGQRVDAAGAEIGADDFLIAAAPAMHPAVAFNPDLAEYFVAWQGADPVQPRASEIYGQRLQATGERLSTKPLRLSDMGTDDDDPAFDALRPAIAYNNAGAYLIVWEGDDDVDGLADGAFEIFGQRLNAATGERLGEDNFRVSAMGRADDDATYGAHRPAVTFNPDHNEFLVVWLGDDDTHGLADNEFEIFGQRLDGASGKAVGPNGFRISAMGKTNDARFTAAYPAVAFEPSAAAYLVVWRGDDNSGALVDGEHEVYARRLAGDRTAESEEAPFRVSDMGATDGETRFGAFHPAVAAGPAGTSLVVWTGDDDEAATDNEQEIFGQLLLAREALAGTLAAFTAAVDSSQGVHLKWTLDGTVLGSGFDVEHRTTGRFEVIGRVSRQDASADGYTFHVADLTPGRHLFRLKQEGPDGAATYSAEIEATVEVPGDVFFSSAYPNPFTDATTITMTVKETQRVELAVYDMLGRRVATLFEGLAEANQARSYAFQADGLPSGPYFVRAIGETFATSKQVMLVR